MIDCLKSFWREDIRVQRNRILQDAKNSGQLLSVSQALRLKEGPVNVSGKIVGVSDVEAMVSEMHFQCSNCSNPPPSTSYASKPVWKVPMKEYSKCPSCKCDGNTLTATLEYVTAIEIQIQDTNKINDIEQLKAILFEQDTENIPYNEIVTLRGNLHVVRKNDNSSNRLIPLLFVESVERQSKEEEVKITETDIQEFKEFVSKPSDEGISLIHDLVLLTAPHIVGNDFAKKAMLIVAVNAGLPNDENRLPKRIRSHAGLIGDPGLAKTQFLREIAELSTLEAV